MNDFKEILSSINNKSREVNNSVMMIDGLNTFLRSFTIINHVNSTGNHIGGLTGALKSIAYGIRLINPTYVIIIFDGVASSSSKRNLYPPYKAHRHLSRATNYNIFSSKEEEDESVKDQISRLMNYLQCLPVSVISIDAVEADDIIGYMTKNLEEDARTEEITIMSADQDFLQLISKKTKVYSPVKKIIYDQKGVIDQYEIPAQNLIFKKILLGDKSDNIPGIEGLGPKKLLKFFPELKEEKECALKDIILKSLENIKDHTIFSLICGNIKQLDINNQLMNLKEIILSDDNKTLVKEMFLHKGTLDAYSFLRMYIQDGLGDSIPNVSSWLNTNFSYLDKID